MSMTLRETLDSFTPRLEIIPLRSSIITPLGRGKTLFFHDGEKKTEDRKAIKIDTREWARVWNYVSPSPPPSPTPVLQR